MRIAIVGASPIPFCRGGIESFMAGLYKAINDHTAHTAELIKIPVRENTVPGIIKAYHTFRRLRLDHFDLVITTKYPAWTIRHPNHVIYLGHRLRGLYDTYPVPPGMDSLWRSNPLQFPGPWIKRIVHWLDNRAIRPETVSYAFCTSQTIAGRSDYFHPDLPPRVVYHSTIHENYHRLPGEYLFTVNRLDPPKRIDLMIRAFMQVQTDVPFLIAGTGPHEAFLKSLAGTDSRIRFLGDVSESELTDLYARSLAVLYTPYAEDYGLITIEAMKSGKPVITTTDSGGPLEFVRNGENGWIASPDPDDLARCITDALSDRTRLENMGNAALKTVETVTWQNTVTQLLAPFHLWPERGPRKRDERRRLLMLVPYPVFPARSGGQRRVAGLATELARVYDIFLLSLGRFNTPRETLTIDPRLHEIRIPMAPAHARAQWEYEKAVGETVSDVALDELLPLTPNYLRALRHFADCSDIIVSEQPYMHRHIPRSNRTKLIVHSSQNFEYDLKKNLLQKTPKGRCLLRRTRFAEAAAVRDSDIVFGVSSDELLKLTAFYQRSSGVTAIAPNGVDTSAVRPFTDGERLAAKERLGIPLDRRVVLFVGAWHPPNLEALRFIAEFVAPGLPDALFLVVGSVRDHLVNQGGDPASLPGNMRLMGEVTEEEKNDALAAADIALNPMLSGSGTNLKILEYAAAGIPVLTTPYGRRGLDLQAERDVCEAEPDGFAAALRDLEADAGKRRKLLESARRVVEERYDWRGIGQAMIAQMEAAIPMAGPASIDMASDAPFLSGWHAPERWEDAGDGPGWVRWTTGRGEVIVSSPRKATILRITVQAGKPGQSVRVLLDGVEMIKECIEKKWTTLEVAVLPVWGSDERHLVIESDVWTPADEGSADARRLGMAVASIAIGSQSRGR
ncbi:glycosyltransferase [bacterium]|nr:glycosyltransferase [candidate division CSSED10-310 bacterium]